MIFVSSVEHFFRQNSLKNSLKCIFLKACSKNASKMHKICYMTPPRGSQDASRTAQDGFCLRFGGHLGAILGIFFRPRRPPGPRDASKRPSWECLGTSWGRVGASWRPRANKSVSWSRLGLILGGFWEVFRRFLEGFGMVFWGEQACTHAGVSACKAARLSTCKHLGT